MTNRRPCPCCGAPLEFPSPEALFQVITAGQKRKLISALAAAFPGFLPMEAIIPHLWHPDREPDDPYNQIKQQIWQTRSALAGTGWLIENSPGNGYRLVKEETLIDV